MPGADGPEDRVDGPDRVGMASGSVDPPGGSLGGCSVPGAWLTMIG